MISFPNSFLSGETELVVWMQMLISLADLVYLVSHRSANEQATG